MDADSLVAHLTALLYAAEEPLSVDQAARVLEASPAAVEVASWPARRGAAPGLAVQQHDGGLRLVAAPASARYVERLLGGPGVTRLSRAALEVLAIVAYRRAGYAR